MKNVFVILFISLIIASCQNEEEISTNNNSYPTDLIEVFDKHGGLSQWQKMKTLRFTVENKGKLETHTVDLNNRREHIKGEIFTTGFDGENYWLEADTSYKGNAIFYHNLMFYFYAMPFVLADNGINYETADTLIFDEKKYIGIRITYENNIGVSPDDEYILYYDVETKQMAWLAYTVTYYTPKDAENTAPKYGWIRYDNWQTIDNIVLPKILTWYKTENNKPTEVRNSRTFTNVKILTETLDVTTYEKTTNAEIVVE